ncbi:MAG TPA: pitrilysin family protein [Candidatus Cryosericum sp.]|nr:pitrilysin family protein [Candidatus Cryosericum sp.]
MTRSAGVVAAQREVLGNGLAAIVRPNRSTRSVALHLALRAGGAFDPPRRSGTASLAARLLDRGAAGLGAQAIARDFEVRGIAFLARARLDSLDITLRLLSRHLPFALERLRDLAASPTFPESECDGERARVLNDIAEREQDTASRAEEALSAALFPEGHPYHAPALGTRDTVAAIGREDLQSFHAARCRPGEAVLVVSGDVEADVALRLSERVFGSWTSPAGPTGRHEASRASDPNTPLSLPDAPPPDAAREIIVGIAGKTQTDIALGFVPAIRRRGPDLQATLVMNSVLGDFGMGGRLGGAIRERAGLAYYAHSYVWAGLGAGPVVMRAGVAPQGVRKAIDLMRRTVSAFRSRGARPSELRDSKQALAAALPCRFETNAGAAALLADCEIQGLGYDFPDRVPDLIAAVDREAVLEAARRYLTPDRCVLVMAGPVREDGASG